MATATIFVVAVAIGFWFLYAFSNVITLLLLAIVLGTAIRPAVDWLHRRGLARVAGVLIIYLLLLAALAVIGILIAPLIAEQAAVIAQGLPGYYETARTWLVGSPSRLVFFIGSRLPGQLPLLLGSLPGAAEPLPVFEQLLRFLLSIFLIFLIGFYWTLESERAIRSLLFFFPRERRERLRAVIDEIDERLGGYIRGQGLLSFSIGTAALVAYWIIGLPYLLVLGIFAGLMELVPILGPALGAIPAILVALTISPEKAIWVVVATLIIQVMENYLLVPQIMKRFVGVSPMINLLAMVTLGSILGIPGALLAIPTAAVLQLILRHWLISKQTAEMEETGGRDYASRLRYQIRELSQDIRKQFHSGEHPASEVFDRCGDQIESIANDLDRLLEADGQEEALDGLESGTEPKRGMFA